MNLLKKKILNIIDENLTIVFIYKNSHEVLFHEIFMSVIL